MSKWGDLSRRSVRGSGSLIHWEPNWLPGSTANRWNRVGFYVILIAGSSSVKLEGKMPGRIMGGCEESLNCMRVTVSMLSIITAHLKIWQYFSFKKFNSFYIVKTVELVINYLCLWMSTFVYYTPTLIINHRRRSAVLSLYGGTCHSLKDTGWLGRVTRTRHGS